MILSKFAVVSLWTDYGDALNIETLHKARYASYIIVIYITAF